MHKLQDQITAVPLSSFGKPYLPPLGPVNRVVDMKTSVRTQVNALGAPEYFKLFARLLKANPPTADGCADGGQARQNRHRSRAGLRPDEAVAPRRTPVWPWRQNSVRTTSVRWREDGVVAGDFIFKNGWAYTTKAGSYGTNYRQRAFVTAVGVGANLPEDAVYPTSDGPTLKQKYSGATKYIDALRQGSAAAGAGILVADHVQRRLLLRRQPAEPLHA